MAYLLNSFPSILLGLMLVITLILLPLLNEERFRRDDEQRTDELHLSEKQR